MDDNKISTDVYHIIKKEVCSLCNIQGTEDCIFKHQNRCCEAYENQADKILTYIKSNFIEKN